MNQSQAVSTFGALAQETRLGIIRFLVECGDHGAPAGDIGAHVDAVSSRLSFHLAALEHAGLVSSVRKSRNIIYRADFDALGDLTSYLLHECCKNHPVVSACCRTDKC